MGAVGATSESGGTLSAIREFGDRVIASDPGLVRARMAISAAVAMSVALAVEFGYAEAIHDASEGILIAMLLGGVVAMMGSMALAGTARRPKLRTGVFFPVAFGAGMLPGALVAGHTDVMLTVFVAVMFAAVWVRRFGPAFFFYGFMLWMGYFFAAFLDATLGELPTLLADVLVGTGVSLLLSVTVLRTHPGRSLRRVRNAFDARARAVARSCADLLEASGDPRRAARARRLLHKRSLRLAEAALMTEAWLAEPGVLPAGWSASALRRRLLDAQLAIDELAHAAESLAEHGGELVHPAARVAGHLARREHSAVLYATKPLLQEDEHTGGVQDPDMQRAFELLGALALALPAARAGDGVEPAGLRDVGTARSAAVRLARAAVRFTVLGVDPASPPTGGERNADGGDAVLDAGEALDTADGIDPAGPFVPAATFVLGVLSGSAAVAGNLAARGGRWNPLSHAKLTTRQAVQVAIAGALAIILGRQISESRYYWAVIATFVTFTGTATRSETSLKAANRVLGTLVGLGAGIGLAELTAGHTLLALAVIVLSMTCGFYVVNISYAGMILFVTIMVSQLYSVLHEFTPGLLVLRLEETALGAAIGIAVGLVVLPTSTRDTLEAAEHAFLEAVATVLDETAAAWEGAATDPNARVRVMEDRMRQLALIARPLTKPLISGADPASLRRRLSLYAAAARHARALAALPPRPYADELGETCRALSRIISGLPETGIWPPQPLQPASA